MNKYKVLIVEDEILVAKYIENILTSNGYASSGIVSTGKEAIKKAEKQAPNLVLMDISIKGEMDGIEAADRIQKKFKIPVIFLTAHFDEEILERAKKTRPFGYLTKPFNDKNLLIMIEISIYKAGKDREKEELLLEKEFSIREREKAMDNIKVLKGILTICCYCNDIKEEDGKWERLADFIHNHSEADFSHGICPRCLKEHYPDLSE
jgi:two-component system, response regulator PdtaR